MSERETDSFIQEVTEEVRQDQMFALWKKWGPFVVGAVIVIVAAAAGWTWWQVSQQKAAEENGARLLAVGENDAAGFDKLAGSIDGPARLIAELSAAAALADKGETAAAATRYAAIAGRGELAPEYRDFARLMAVRLGAKGIDADAMIEQVARGDGPYRLLALELRAVRQIRAGETTKAHATLNKIIRDTDATSGLRDRARLLLRATGGKVETTGQG